MQEIFVQCKLVQKFYTASCTLTGCSSLLEERLSSILFLLWPNISGTSLSYLLIYKCSHQDIEETMTGMHSQTLFAQVPFH